MHKQSLIILFIFLQLIKDTRLLRLHNTKQENLTKTIRQVRGEYLYIPQHIARNSLEARNRK